MIKERGPLGEEETVAMIQQFVSALEFVHGKRIIHRDLKPANLLLTPGTKRPFAPSEKARVFSYLPFCRHRLSAGWLGFTFGFGFLSRPRSRSVSIRARRAIITCDMSSLMATDSQTVGYGISANARLALNFLPVLLQRRIVFLASTELKVLLADFGVAKMLPDGEDSMTGVCGTEVRRCVPADVRLQSERFKAHCVESVPRSSCISLPEPATLPTSPAGKKNRHLARYSGSSCVSGSICGVNISLPSVNPCASQESTTSSFLECYPPRAERSKAAVTSGTLAAAFGSSAPKTKV